MRFFWHQIKELGLIQPLKLYSQIDGLKILTNSDQNGLTSTYLCWEEKTNRQYYVKEYTPYRLAIRNSDGTLEPLNNQEYNIGLNSFLREAQVLSLINHPSIIKVERCFEKNNTGYFVMNNEDTINLMDFIGRKSNYAIFSGDYFKFEETEIELIIFPLCDALFQLHRHSLIHRNLTPENILIRSDGSPILIGFGLVSYFKSVNINEYKVFGISQYAPIENYDQTYPQGPWTDIYSLGAIIHTLMTGRYPNKHPLDREINPEVFDSIFPLTKYAVSIYSTNLVELVSQCLSFNYKDRPSNIYEVLSFFKGFNYKSLRDIIESNIIKAIQYFLNNIDANSRVYVDEFISFFTSFSVIDLKWRILKGGCIGNEELFNKIIQEDFVNEIIKLIGEPGFISQKRIITIKTIISRLDEYGIIYQLDRTEKDISLKQTIQLCTKNCLIMSTIETTNNFISLMDEVIKLYTSEMKKELGQ
jgi:serine/threonine protein kinase